MWTLIHDYDGDNILHFEKYETCPEIGPQSTKQNNVKITTKWIQLTT